jgi:hypothetical protein
MRNKGSSGLSGFLLRFPFRRDVTKNSREDSYSRYLFAGVKTGQEKSSRADSNENGRE